LLSDVPPATPDTTPSGTSRPSRLPNMNWRMRPRVASAAGGYLLGTLIPHLIGR